METKLHFCVKPAIFVLPATGQRLLNVIVVKLAVDTICLVPPVLRTVLQRTMEEQSQLNANSANPLALNALL